VTRNNSQKQTSDKTEKITSPESDRSEQAEKGVWQTDSLYNCKKTNIMIAGAVPEV